MEPNQRAMIVEFTGDDSKENKQSTCASANTNVTPRTVNNVGKRTNTSAAAPSRVAEQTPTNTATSSNGYDYISPPRFTVAVPEGYKSEESLVFKVAGVVAEDLGTGETMKTLKEEIDVILQEESLPPTTRTKEIRRSLGRAFKWKMESVPSWEARDPLARDDPADCVILIKSKAKHRSLDFAIWRDMLILPFENQVLRLTKPNLDRYMGKHMYGAEIIHLQHRIWNEKVSTAFHREHPKPLNNKNSRNTRIRLCLAVGCNQNKVFSKAQAKIYDSGNTKDACCEDCAKKRDLKKKQEDAQKGSRSKQKQLKKAKKLKMKVNSLEKQIEELKKSQKQKEDHDSRV